MCIYIYIYIYICIYMSADGARRDQEEEGGDDGGGGHLRSTLHAHARVMIMITSRFIISSSIVICISSINIIIGIDCIITTIAY